jgi:hypothetical protein
MSLPNQLKSARMDNNTIGDTVDNHMTDLETAICDILGIPIGTNISAALFEAVAAGLKTVNLIDAAANPGANGAIRRNGNDLKVMLNGVVRTLANLDEAQILTNKTVYGSSSAAGNLTLGSTTHGTKGKVLIGAALQVDEANLRVGINRVPANHALELVGGVFSTDVGAGGNPQVLFRANPLLDLGELGTISNHPFIITLNSQEAARYAGLNGQPVFGVNMAPIAVISGKNTSDLMEALEMIGDGANANFASAMFIGSSAGPGMNFTKGRGSYASPGQVLSGDVIFGVNAFPIDSTQVERGPTASITARATHDITPTDWATDISFYYVRHATTAQVRGLYLGSPQHQLGDTDQPIVIATNKATPSTSDGMWWVDVGGVSPSRTAAIKVNDGGSVKTIASITY